MKLCNEVINAVSKFTDENTMYLIGDLYDVKQYTHCFVCVPCNISAGVCRT